VFGLGCCDGILENILTLSHFSRFSYVAPILASVYEGGDIQNVWIVKIPSIHHLSRYERLAKKGEIDLKMIMTPESSGAIADFSGDEQVTPRPSLWLRIPVVFQLEQALSVLKKLGYRLSVINSVFPDIPLEQLKQSHFFWARCNQEGLGIGVLLVFKAHGFIMPNSNQAWHFELHNMDQL